MVSRGQFVSELTLGVVVPYELVMESLALAKDSMLGAVVNIGSQYGAVAINPQLYSDKGEHSPAGHYGVAKAALGSSLVKLRRDCQAVGSGLTASRLVGSRGAWTWPLRERYAKLCPSGRTP